MIYILTGEEELFVLDKLNEFKKNNANGYQYFDGLSKDFSIEEVIDSCINGSLFSEKNTVLVKDPLFLIKKFDENQLKKIYSYIDNPLYETDLVFFTLDNSFDKKLKAYKKISSNANVLEYKKLDNDSFTSYGFSLLRKYNLKLNEKCSKHLFDICKNDSSLLKRNIEVLINYPDEINVDVIEKLATSSDELNSFDLINALTRKDLSLSIHYAHRILNDTDSLISTIGLLASQLRFYYQIAYYLSINKNKNEILRITNCKEGRFYNVLKILERFKANDILLLLSKLSDLDLKCKTSFNIDDVEMFDLFIIDLIKGNYYASN